MDSPPVVLITGCSSGLGLQAAVESARRGAKVVATMRNLDRKNLLMDACREAGVAVEVMRLDVCIPQQREGVVQEVIKRFQRIDVLINNAGFGVLGAFEDLSSDDLRQIFETNLFGAMEMASLVLPHMRTQASGRILNIGSAASAMPLPLMSSYISTKAAMEAWSHALGAELRPLGIQVCCVQPGFTKTDFAGRSMIRRAPVDMDGPYGTTYLGMQLNTTPETAFFPTLGAAKVGKRIAALGFKKRIPARYVIGLDAKLSRIGVRLFGMTTIRDVLSWAIQFMGRRIKS